MRRKERSAKSLTSEILTPTRVYIEDIQDIIRIFQGVGADTLMETELYESITSIDELVEAHGGRRIKLLAISATRGGQPIARVNLGSGSATISLSSRTPEMIGLRLQLSNVLWRRTRDFALITAGYMYAFFCFLGGAAFLGDSGLELPTSLPGLLLMMLGTAIFVAWRYQLRKYYTLIDIVRKTEAPSFLARNRDALIVATVSGVAGTVIGTLLVWFLIS